MKRPIDATLSEAAADLLMEELDKKGETGDRVRNEALTGLVLIAFKVAEPRRPLSVSLNSSQVTDTRSTS